MVYNKADKALYHVKQNGKNGCGFYDETKPEDNEGVDVKLLLDGIRNSGDYKGAMGVEYREFAKLFDFVDNLEKRFSYPFKMIVISLNAPEGTDPGIDELEKSVYYMEQSIRQTIREVDIMTRYSSRHILVMLVGTDEEGVRSSVDRIFRGYYKMNGSSAFSPSYTVADHHATDGREEAL